MKIPATLIRIIIFGIITITAALILRFSLGGPEDSWICVNGEWVKHGMPSAPMPTEQCK
jgi:hypothetical protein